MKDKSWFVVAGILLFVGLFAGWFLFKATQRNEKIKRYYELLPYCPQGHVIMYWDDKDCRIEYKAL